ncbi:hypothetical protein K438DRAFT_1747467 [Mycena galopus ATCC 62051]|nr:hypothetical protein K438DRAFT_1747467 [Mycena galopus ATCC 62051]
MSTLQIIWNTKTADAAETAWSWDNRNTHYTAQIVRRIRKEVYMVRIGARGKEPIDIVALKIARGYEEVEEMEREAGFYENQLKDLQGTVVPKCYGFYTAKIRGTQALGCLLLEYCSGAPVELLRVRKDEVNWKTMQAAYAVHEAGVLHGDLLDGRHFIPMGLDVRIIDFSVSVAHHCVSGLSKRAAGHGRHRVCGCPELAVLENVYLPLV